MSWTLHTSGSAIATAGANVNSSIISYTGVYDDYLDQWSDEAEAICCNEARMDLVTNYASLTEKGKEILGSICDAYVAQKIIGYEPEAIGTIGAALRLNILENQMRRGLNQIKDDKVKTYLSIT